MPRSLCTTASWLHKSENRKRTVIEVQFFEISQVASIVFATQFLQNWGSLFDLVSLLTQLATTNSTKTTVLKETGVKVQRILFFWNKGSAPFHFTALKKCKLFKQLKYNFTEQMLGWRQQTGQTGLLRVGKSALGLLLGRKWQLGKGPMLGGSAITAAKRINNMAPLWDPVRRISIDGAMLWFTEFFKVSKNQGVNRVICHGRLRQTTGTSESQRNQWLSWSIDVYIYMYQDKELHSHVCFNDTNTLSSMFSNLANSCLYHILILTHPHQKIRLRIWSVNIYKYKNIYTSYTIYI